MAKGSYLAVLGSKVTTLLQLMAHFSKGKKLFLVPLLIVILLSAVMLILAGGLSYVAPFVYSIV
jgi:uncharacterized membrane protein